MSFSFAKDSSRLLFADEYLALHPRRGRSFSVRSLGLTFHGITDCLFVKGAWQVLLPVQENGSLTYIFRESCPYLANEPDLAASAQRGLEAVPHAAIVEVEEAAPFVAPGSNNLWHWVAESLPKILALELTGYSGKYIVPPGSSVAAQCFEMFGIAADRLLPGNGTYRIGRLILPPRLSGFSLVHNMPLCDFTRGKLLEAVGELPGNKRCYIRRIGIRKVQNEAELLQVLDDFGFEVMTPEDLSLQEQFRYMTNVECSVMAHGANSTLTLLQKPRSTFIELFGNRYISYNNLHAARLLKLRYHAVVEDLDPSCCPPEAPTVQQYLQTGGQADMLVDLDYVRILLESALA